VRNQPDQGQSDASGKVCISASPYLMRQVPETDLQGYHGLVLTEMNKIRSLVGKLKTFQWELRHLSTGPEESEDGIGVIDGRRVATAQILLLETERISNQMIQTSRELVKARDNLARFFDQYMQEVGKNTKESQNMLNGEDGQNKSLGGSFLRFVKYIFLGM